MRFNTYRDEKDRINDTIQRTKIFESVPAPKNALRLRSRSKKEDLSEAFHLKPKNEQERLFDLVKEKFSMRKESLQKLKKLRQTKSMFKIEYNEELPELPIFPNRENSNRFKTIDSDAQRINKVTLYKALFKEEKKTHFKSAASLYIINSIFHNK